MKYTCRNCGGGVFYNEGYLKGWGHIIATGCVNPAVTLSTWKEYLWVKKQIKALAKSK